MKGRSVAPSVDDIETLAYYTVELTAPGSGWSNLQELTHRARRACADLERDGERVRFIRSIFVPEDNTCFFLYEAVSAGAVREAALRAELPAPRSVTVVDSSKKAVG